MHREIRVLNARHARGLNPLAQRFDLRKFFDLPRRRINLVRRRGSLFFRLPGLQVRRRHQAAAQSANLRDWAALRVQQIYIAGQHFAGSVLQQADNSQLRARFRTTEHAHLVCAGRQAYASNLD